mgnify:CR=1 FL=1
MNFEKLVKKQQLKRQIKQLKIKTDKYQIKIVSTYFWDRDPKRDREHVEDLHLIRALETKLKALDEKKPVN